MAEAADLTFWGGGTMRTLRPIWTAEELGIPYAHRSIGPRTGETQTVEYTRLNPKQKVPFMVDGDLELSESIAISRYLIDRYGSTETISRPDTVAARAREDEWICHIYGEIDETSLYVMRRHGDLPQIYGEAPQAVETSRAYAQRHLDIVSAALGERGCAVGERFSLVDIVLVSCLDWAVHYGFRLSDTLWRYRETNRARPAYQRAFKVNYAGHT